MDITAKLRENLSHLLNDENDLIKHDKPLKCNPFFSGIFSEIEASFLQTKEAYNSGNLYMTNKNLERVDVLSELMSILFEICGNIESMMRVDVLSELMSILFEICGNIESMMRVEYKRDAVFEMKGELIGSVRVLAQNLFDDLTFEQSSEIICRHLKEKDADRFGLCENPINNPSWIYSVNHFLRQVE